MIQIRVTIDHTPSDESRKDIIDYLYNQIWKYYTDFKQLPPPSTDILYNDEYYTIQNISMDKEEYVINFVSI